jgi:hypothetical protein
MATPSDLAAARYRQVQTVTRQLITLIQRLWGSASAASIEADLEGETGAAILAAVTAGQVTVAQGAQAFVAGAMAEQGGTAFPEALLIAEAFAGIAPDGGPLETLLYVPAIGVRRRIAAGMTGEEAMVGGLADMARYVATSVSDVARSSVQVGMAADRQCVAYMRVVTLPACSRCIVLSGQQYPYSEGFLRHPNCDCQTVPLRKREWGEVPTPQRLFDQLSERDQRRVFTVAGARAIREGADIGQVVNARREGGMSVAHVHGRDVAVTSEGATRRSLYGQQLRRAGGAFAKVPGKRYSQATTPRLMPEEIFRLHPEDRSEQLRLLRRYGYIV